MLEILLVMVVAYIVASRFLILDYPMASKIMALLIGSIFGSLGAATISVLGLYGIEQTFRQGIAGNIDLTSSSLNWAVRGALRGFLYTFCFTLLAVLFLRLQKRIDKTTGTVRSTNKAPEAVFSQRSLIELDRNAPPLNKLPPIVWVLALPLIAMEVVLSLADRGILGGAQGIGWRADAFQRFAFDPDLWRRMMAAGVYPLDGLARLVTFPLVHLGFTHALFAVVILLAIGKMVGEVFHWAAVVAVFVGATVVGALVYAAVPGVMAGLTGAYPAVYGLIGAFTFLLWVRLVAKGANQLRAFTLIGFMLGFQLLFGLLFGAGWDWVADFAGFATGFLMSFVVSPGGLNRVRDRIRQR